MRKKVTNIVTFDNRTDTLRNTKGITFDIIAFSKREASMEPEKTFHERLKSADEKIRNTYIADRDFTKNFMKDHKLNSVSYSLLYEDDDFLVYKKTN